MEITNRCRWVNMKNPAYVAYHDKEWGVPCHDEQKLYEKQNELLANTSIIRNRLKIQAAVTNSAVFKKIQQEFGSFASYLWAFSNGQVIQEECTIRTTSPLSDKISKDLKKRGMKFVGSTTIYAYLQAVGVINGHEKGCDCCRL